MNRKSLFFPLTSSTQRWTFAGITIFFTVIFITTILVAMFNRGFANHVMWPVLQYIDLFKLLFADNPIAALQFIATKSVFVVAHKDPRSGLNIWTVEFDSISLVVYAVFSLFAAWILFSAQKSIKSGLFPLMATTVIGALLIYASVAYMTAIDHCAGPTWVGFVALYGLGFNEFELYPYYQWLFAFAGIIMLLISLIKIRYMKKPDIA